MYSGLRIRDYWQVSEYSCNTPLTIRPLDLYNIAIIQNDGTATFQYQVKPLNDTPKSDFPLWAILTISITSFALLIIALFCILKYRKI